MATRISLMTMRASTPRTRRAAMMETAMIHGRLSSPLPQSAPREVKG